eukprot:6337058-Amphidinium_carterae.1
MGERGSPVPRPPLVLPTLAWVNLLGEEGLEARGPFRMPRNKPRDAPSARKRRRCGREPDG